MATYPADDRCHSRRPASLSLVATMRYVAAIPNVLEGDGPPPRSVLLEFDGPERAMEWYNSPQYQAALQIRLRSAKTKVLMLTGHSEGVL